MTREGLSLIRSRCFAPAWVEFTSVPKRSFISALVLAIPLVVALLQLLVAAALGTNVHSAYNRPQDRIVVLSLGVDGNSLVTQDQARDVAMDIEEQINPTRVGWSRQLTYLAGHNAHWKQATDVEVREATPSYLEILVPESEQDCQTCLYRQGGAYALGSQIKASELDLGAEYPIAGSVLTYSGTLSNPWRDSQLSAAAVIDPNLATVVDGSVPQQAKWAVQLDSVPTEGQIRALRALVNPDAPETVAVESALASSSVEDDIKEMVKSSGSFVQVAVIIVFIFIACVSQLLQFQKKRTILALLRSFGASKTDIIHLCICRWGIGRCPGVPNSKLGYL